MKVTTSDGLVGYGESCSGRAPLAIAATINTTLRDLFTGLDAAAPTAVWDVFERRVLANHGTCGACVCAMSGVDMALWDIKGKAIGEPLYRLLGGLSRPVPAYAGGFALGYASPAAVAAEALGQVAAGYRAVKLRLGDTLNRDMERTVAIRSALPSDVALLADANCRYSVDDVRAMLPVLAEAGQAGSGSRTRTAATPGWTSPPACAAWPAARAEPPQHVGRNAGNVIVTWSRSKRYLAFPSL